MIVTVALVVISSLPDASRYGHDSPMRRHEPNGCSHASPMTGESPTFEYGRATATGTSVARTMTSARVGRGPSRTTGERR